MSNSNESYIHRVEMPDSWEIKDFQQNRDSVLLVMEGSWKKNDSFVREGIMRVEVGISVHLVTEMYIFPLIIGLIAVVFFQTDAIQERYLATFYFCSLKHLEHRTMVQSCLICFIPPMLPKSS